MGTRSWQGNYSQRLAGQPSRRPPPERTSSVRIYLLGQTRKFFSRPGLIPPSTRVQVRPPMRRHPPSQIAGNPHRRGFSLTARSSRSRYRLRITVARTASTGTMMGGIFRTAKNSRPVPALYGRRPSIGTAVGWPFSAKNVHHTLPHRFAVERLRYPHGADKTNAATMQPLDCFSQFPSLDRYHCNSHSVGLR
jgi:hypothetical protein